MYHPVPILVHSLGLRGTRMSESGLPAPSSDVTVLLWRLGEGDANVANELARLVYEELHRIADRAMRSERPDHTLQPTLLVNEAFVRLIGQREARWQSRAQFYAMAAQAIRRILVDHARARRRLKRDFGLRVTLNYSIADAPDRMLDLLSCIPAARAAGGTLNGSDPHARGAAAASVRAGAGNSRRPERGVPGPREWSKQRPAR